MIDVTTDDGDVTVRLTGWDWIFSGRRNIEFTSSQITAVATATRRHLEAQVDHRVSGIGTHDGRRKPGGKRVGSMMSRQTRGIEFWGVPPGDPDATLLVLDLDGHRFDRAVLAVGEPDLMAGEHQARD